MLVLWLGDPHSDEVHLTGGKGASLSRMVRAGVPVPPGFVVTSRAYREALASAPGWESVCEELRRVCDQDLPFLSRATQKAREAILAAPMPPAVAERVGEAYRRLGEGSASVAVRSSATAEDLEGASFAGQQETFLHVCGESEVQDCIRRCWASLFTERAVFYRRRRGFTPDEVAMAVVVQRMVRAEKAGVMFTVNPVTRDPGQVMVEAVWGLGEAVVSGLVTPDNYLLDKGSGAELSAYVPAKEVMITHREDGQGCATREVPPQLRECRVLSPQELRQLWQLGRRLEEYFRRPQDVEWCFEGGCLWALQSRPVTTV